MKRVTKSRSLPSPTFMDPRAWMSSVTKIIRATRATGANASLRLEKRAWRTSRGIVNSRLPIKRRESTKLTPVKTRASFLSFGSLRSVSAIIYFFSKGR